MVTPMSLASPVSVSEAFAVFLAIFRTITRLPDVVPPGVIDAVVGDSWRSPVANSVSVDVTSVPNAESIGSSFASSLAENPHTTPPDPESAVQVADTVNVEAVHAGGVLTRTVADSSVVWSKSTVSYPMKFPAVSEVLLEGPLVIAGITSDAHTEVAVADDDDPKSETSRQRLTVES